MSVNFSPKPELFIFENNDELSDIRPLNKSITSSISESSKRSECVNILWGQASKNPNFLGEHLFSRVETVCSGSILECQQPQIRNQSLSACLALFPKALVSQGFLRDEGHCLNYSFHISSGALTSTSCYCS